jgi:uncharacterized protein DUF4276
VAKRVVVIVSGETDRRTIPLLCRQVLEQAELFDVRKPPGNAALTPEQATKLVKAAWFEMKGRQTAPEKFVVLVDADANAKTPAAAARPFEEAVARLADIPVPRLVAVAVRHLEAWFFGHAEGLREYLNRDPGQVDTSRPDEIDNPKLHLMNLLQSRSRVYTARVAEQIAGLLDPATIESRSPSFASFVKKLRNGL